MCEIRACLPRVLSLELGLVFRLSFDLTSTDA
jgi:hypothetical protein